MPETELYFAYGSNLDLQQMAGRCPGAVAAGAATLMDHRLVFAGHSRTWQCAVATVVPDPGGRVPGLLYTCTLLHRDALDGAEGHPRSYRRVVMTVVTGDGREVEAYLYVKPVGADGTGVPSAAYAGMIRRAYERLGFEPVGLPEGR